MEETTTVTYTADQTPAASTRYRQAYHFTPPAGWLNDPNGLIFYRGQYHIFYQSNPYTPQWNSMHWGHALSDDLILWQHLPTALAPDQPYDNDPKGGCFSGTSIEHEGVLYLFYTGSFHRGKDQVQVQCMAYSSDGVHFEKYSKNPVLTAPDGYSAANFRDPKVWKQDETFYLLCSGQKNNRAVLLLYRSLDLFHWEFFNIMMESRGELGAMWECPDFYPLDGKYVLTISPIGLGDRKAMYFTGDMDYRTGRFHPQVCGEVNWGMDFYAAQTMVDESQKRICIGWANGWDWMPWWKNFGNTQSEGWCGAFNLPREVRLTRDHTLKFLPVEGIKRYQSVTAEAGNITIEHGKYPIDTRQNPCFELKLAVDLKRTTAESFELLLRSGQNLATRVHFDLAHGEAVFDRNHSDGFSAGRCRCPLKCVGHTLLIDLFSDNSSIELFTDDYETCMSCNIYPSRSQTENYIECTEGILYVEQLNCWEININSFKTED